MRKLLPLLLILCAATTKAGEEATSATFTEGGICIGTSHYVKYAYNDKVSGIDIDESIFTNTSIFARSKEFQSLSSGDRERFNSFIRALTVFVYDGKLKSLDEYKERFMILCEKATRPYTL